MINDILTEDRRLVILRSLLDCNNESNESILQDCLDAYGHNVSRDVVRGQIDWLAEQNLVTVENLSGFYVVTLTGRGQDVAEGRAKVSGVKRPRAR
ncbi:ArsR family transcriptional regulator [Salmonella enterica]|nr:ArsR family transcriptional regulator [Salmonella enterica]ECT8279498.1 ArsR family transcriptional regulator [Salmonella enterica subsp. enterica]EDV7219547.1 ArsR family transcriptional regulator [Salmonella enterica subsp. enterica serovar Saintpaul]HCZ4652245.1 ArsR family transcriptional regulator [Salmonella enterica subsp. enterica serovar Saintpaul str. CFSAN004157]HCZ4691432.1 ArsR family transcriptional regulator [Salmonella enterica subsp. enterica serovar Saintpaul str. CFSAN0041